MPCSHLFRVIRDHGGCIGYYINERWYHEKHNVAVKKPSRPSLKHKRIWSIGFEYLVNVIDIIIFNKL